MKPRFFTPAFSLVAFLAIAPSARSQDSAAVQPGPPPPRPFIAPLKGDFTLVAKYFYKAKTDKVPTPQPQPDDNGAPKSPDLAELDATQTGALRMDKQIFVDGTSSEIWRSGQLRFITGPAHDQAPIVASQTINFYVDPLDFKEFGWIGAKNFQGTQVIEGKSYYVFKQDKTMAWIDTATKRPYLLDSDALRVTYTFGTPDTVLQLPPNCAQKLQQMKRSWAGAPN